MEHELGAVFGVVLYEKSIAIGVTLNRTMRLLRSPLEEATTAIPV